MKFIPTPIEDLFIVEPAVFEDPRGYFFESYNKTAFAKQGIDLEFLQDNQSISQKGVLRGLHFQNPPFAQGKLVRVLRGAVLDVVVDIRKKSKTYGKWINIELTPQNKKMLLVPKGCAHGFQALEKNTVVEYFVSQYYAPSSESGIRWNDPFFKIQWPIRKAILSSKDEQWPLVKY